MVEISGESVFGRGTVARVIGIGTMPPPLNGGKHDPRQLRRARRRGDGPVQAVRFIWAAGERGASGIAGAGLKTRLRIELRRRSKKSRATRGRMSASARPFT